MVLAICLEHTSNIYMMRDASIVTVYEVLPIGIFLMLTLIIRGITIDMPAEISWTISIVAAGGILFGVIKASEKWKQKKDYGRRDDIVLVIMIYLLFPLFALLWYMVSKGVFTPIPAK